MTQVAVDVVVKVGEVELVFRQEANITARPVDYAVLQFLRNGVAAVKCAYPDHKGPGKPPPDPDDVDDSRDFRA